MFADDNVGITEHTVCLYAINIHNKLLMINVSSNIGPERVGSL